MSSTGRSKGPIYTLVCSYCGHVLVELTFDEVRKLVADPLVTEILPWYMISKLVNKLKHRLVRCPRCGAKLTPTPCFSKITWKFLEEAEK